MVNNDRDFMLQIFPVVKSRLCWLNPRFGFYVIRIYFLYRMYSYL